MVPCGSGATGHHSPGMLTRGCARHENRACFKRQPWRRQAAEMPNVPRRKLARLLKRVYHGCGTGKGHWGDRGKSLDVNISVELGLLLVCLCRCNDWGDLWVVFRTIAHGPVSVQDPDDSRVPVPSGPLAIFNSKPVLFALEPY